MSIENLEFKSCPICQAKVNYYSKEDTNYRKPHVTIGFKCAGKFELKSIYADEYKWYYTSLCSVGMDKEIKRQSEIVKKVLGQDIEVEECLI